MRVDRSVLSRARDRRAAARARLVARLDDRHRLDRVGDGADERRVLAGDEALQVRHRPLERFGEPRAAQRHVAATRCRPPTSIVSGGPVG